METLEKIKMDIKWYHVTIICLFVVILFFIFTGKNTCKNADKTSEGFAGTNIDGEIVLYYAMWCGHSRTFLPEWDKFETYAKDNLKNIKVTKVLCEGDNESICKQKNVRGYPTVVLYLKNGTVKGFDDERTSEALSKFIQENVK